MNKWKRKWRIFLWKIGLLPEEICPICGNDKTFKHGFKDWNRRKCGLFVDDLPEKIKKIVREKIC